MKPINDVIFTESDHTYHSPTKGYLTSVTTKLKEYQNEFPKNALKKYAFKNGLSEAYVKYCWDEQRRLGTEIGNYLHIQLENRLQNKVPDLSYLITKEDSIEKDLQKKQFLQNYHTQINQYLSLLEQEEKDNKGEYLGSEVIATRGSIAGQIDHLRTTHIDDFKNDKRIDFYNQYQKMKPPFDDLDDCNWNKYCLQVNMYRYMLPDYIKKNMYRPDRIIKFDRWGNKPQILEIPNMQERVKILFDDK